MIPANAAHASMHIHTRTHTLVRTHVHTRTHTYHLYCASLVFRYITSIYWAVSTMTTVGYGDITAVRIEEKIVSSLVMVLGSSMFAYMMGSVATLIANR